MPPGFTQELRFQITQNDPPVDSVTGVPIIDFENYCCGMCAMLISPLETLK